LRLPGTGDGERAVQNAWRAEHGAVHAGGDGADDGGAHDAWELLRLAAGDGAVRADGGRARAAVQRAGAAAGVSAGGDGGAAGGGVAGGVAAAGASG
jgi:hypothetical protein